MRPVEKKKEEEEEEKKKWKGKEKKKKSRKPFWCTLSLLQRQPPCQPPPPLCNFLSEACRPLQGCTLLNCSSHPTAMLHTLALSSPNASEEKKSYIKHQTQCLCKENEAKWVAEEKKKKKRKKPVSCCAPKKPKALPLWVWIHAKHGAELPNGGATAEHTCNCHAIKQSLAAMSHIWFGRKKSLLEMHWADKKKKEERH